jgi:hypothetical protein
MQDEAEEPLAFKLLAAGDRERVAEAGLVVFAHDPPHSRGQVYDGSARLGSVKDGFAVRLNERRECRR